jgi:hypothetical protein
MFYAVKFKNNIFLTSLSANLYIEDSEKETLWN